MNDMMPWIAGALASAEGGEKEAPPLGYGVFFYIILTLVVIFWVLLRAKGGLGDRVPKRPSTQWAEHLYLFIERMAISVIGPNGRQYITFLATIWLIVFVSNVLGLFMTTAATANFAFNAGLGIASVLYVQWAGIKANGFFGHLKHFAGPKLKGILGAISILLFTVEIISESAKMLSLPFRLFMNIEGGHIVTKGFNSIIKIAGMEFPLGTFLFPIELLTAVIQAFIFTVLVSVYISLVSHHEEGEHESKHEEPIEERHVVVAQQQ